MFGLTSQRNRLAEGGGAAVANPISRVRRSAMVMALAAALGITALSMSLQTSTAAASSEGCTYTSFPWDYVCFDINGSGTRVDSFVVIRGKAPHQGALIRKICNFEGRVRVTAPSGAVWNYSSFNSGCQLSRATRTVNVNRNFPSGSRACGSFYENGVLQDTACNKIHS